MTEIVLQQLPVSQSRAFAQKYGREKALDDLAGLTGCHVVVLVGALAL